MQEFKLPFPPSILNPNKKAHWATKATVAKKYRRSCWVDCKAQGAKPMHSEILMHLIFHEPDKRKRDDDNMESAFKAGRDGVADAIHLDDKYFTTTKERGKPDPKKLGYVIVRLNHKNTNITHSSVSIPLEGTIG